MLSVTTKNSKECKRLCFFAGYDEEGIIRDYVIYYIKELSKFSDVFYVGDFDTSNTELQKLADITIGSIAQRHKKYDFGSWALAFSSNTNILNKYDELILVNDSCYGPIYPLKKVFDEMDAKKIDAWSICGNHFLMSFFVVLNRKLFLSSEFYHFITNITPEKNKSMIIKKYERGLDNLIREKTNKFGIYCSKLELKKFYNEHRKEIKKVLKLIPILPRILIRLRPEKIRLYEDGTVILLMMQFPLIKKLYFKGDNYTARYYLQLLKIYTNYPINLIQNNLNNDFVRKSNWGNILLNRIKMLIRNFLFQRIYSGNKYIVKILKIPFYIKRNNYKF